MSLQQNKTYFRWVVAGLVTLITVINYLDRSAIAYAIHPIQQEFGFDDTQFGLIGSAFAIGYLFSTFWGGILVDRFGTRYVWAIAALVWSLSLILLSQANALISFLILRMLLGLGEGPHFPAMTRTLANWLPMKERARALGLNLVGVPLASLIGAPLISSLIVAFGWKITFLLLGSLGIGWVFLWLFFFRNHPQESSWVSTAECAYIQQDQDLHEPAQASTPVNWKNILLNRTFITTTLAFFSFGYFVFFAITWFPGYLAKTYQLKLQEIGLLLIAPWATASLFILIGGFLSDWIWKHTANLRFARSYLIGISQLLSAFSLVPLLFLYDVGWVLFFLSLATGFAFLPNASFFALNADLSHEHAGKSQGAMSTFFAFSGILAPFLTGLLTDWTGNFNAAIFIVLFLSMFSALGILFFQFPNHSSSLKNH